MTATTCEDAEMYEKRRENLRYFLDHLPSHPCCDRPNFNLCTICFKINFDIARDCEVYQRFHEGLSDERSTDPIHIELARAVDLGTRKEEEASLSEEMEKEFPLFEFSTPTIKTSIFEVDVEEEEEAPPPKPKKKVKTKKKVKAKKTVKTKKAVKVKKAVKAKKAKKVELKEKAKVTTFSKLEKTFRSSDVRPFDAKKDPALLKGGIFCMWKSMPNDDKVTDSPTIDMWNEFYDSLEGIEPKFWKFINKFLGKGPQITDGAPVFIYGDKWAGVVNISKDKGIRVFMDHNRSSVPDRMEVLDLLNEAALTLRKKAQARGEALQAKTNSKKVWNALVTIITKQESEGAEINEVGKLDLGGEEEPTPPRAQVRKVKKVATPPEKSVVKKVVKKVVKAPPTGPEPGETDTTLERKAPTPPPKPGGSVPPLFATLGKLETKKKEEE